MLNYKDYPIIIWPVSLRSWPIRRRPQGKIVEVAECIRAIVYSYKCGMSVVCMKIIVLLASGLCCLQRRAVLPPILNNIFIATEESWVSWNYMYVCPACVSGVISEFKKIVVAEVLTGVKMHSRDSIFYLEEKLDIYNTVRVNHATSHTKKLRVHTYGSFLTSQARKPWTHCVILGLNLQNLCWFIHTSLQRECCEMMLIQELCWWIYFLNVILMSLSALCGEGNYLLMVFSFFFFFCHLWTWICSEQSLLYIYPGAYWLRRKHVLATPTCISSLTTLEARPLCHCCETMTATGMMKQKICTYIVWCHYSATSHN